ncbi:hypothetical protein [Archangium lansingense]|uniref:HEXXH motif-containing protein n=1 Tax=Archangium lansingense TaxID=2995310 RepID=A0ABT3ZYJ5_9BACT|nr:hypothetical protein [Archangium lansinium]MCY1073809.1 hypothetical protein [Archangium lansinium]
MAAAAFASWMLSQEARALLTRLGLIKPFVLQETMVPAAALSTAAQTAIESYLLEGRRVLRRQILQFLEWLDTPEGRQASPAEAQKRFVLLRLRFNVVLSQFDLFNEAMSQRSEAETGVWLAGLDVAAQDALALPGYFEPPPVVCYLARGPGAAIRRARTRLPGGGDNPVAIIRIPRERMIGSGIASSLIHEVGHQGAALLELLPSLREAVQAEPRSVGSEDTAWRLWERWLSEIIADLWSVARVGVTSTLGLLAVVSLPRAFVFRPNFDDPHPSPWVRVKLSCALGDALYPHPQWGRLSRLWEQFYPTEGLGAERRAHLAAMEQSMPRFVELLLSHRPERLRGRSLAQALLMKEERQPARLGALYREWRAAPALMRGASPSLVFAVLGQARANGTITPEEEGKALAELLRYWALRSTLDTSAECAAHVRQAGREAALRLSPPFQQAFND